MLGNETQLTIDGSAQQASQQSSASENHSKLPKMLRECNETEGSQDSMLDSLVIYLPLLKEVSGSTIISIPF